MIKIILLQIIALVYVLVVIICCFASNYLTNLLFNFIKKNEKQH